MLSLILDVRLNDISSYYLNKKMITFEAKTNLVLSKGAKNYFFIYDNTEFKHFWNLILKNGSTKMTFLRSVKFWFLFSFLAYLI